MNQIYDPGNPKDFGHEFNYEAWTADNEFTLCNVPWDNNYRDVHTYNSFSEIDAYINSMPSNARVEIKGTRGRINAPLRIDLPLGKAMKYNYLRVKNTEQPVIGGDQVVALYYFIVGINEIAPNTTELVLQLDVWSTFGPLITGVRGFVERGHVAMANSKRKDSFGRDYLSIPEGLDTGSEYRGVAVRNETVMDVNNLNVIALFANDPSAPKYKTVNGQQVPNYTSARGGKVFGVPSGADARMWPSADAFLQFMNDNRDTPWVTQQILAVMLVPSLERYGLANFFDGYDPLVGRKAPSNPMSGERLVDLGYNQWRYGPGSYLDAIPERYRKLDKLRTSPYTMIEVTCLTGTPITIKPENWPTDGALLQERANILPPGARVQFRPYMHGVTGAGGVSGGEDDGNFTYDRGGSYWDFFTQIGSFPTVPIVNDGQALALAGQAGSLAYGQRSADWAQQKALQSAQTGYDQATSGMNLASNLNQISQSTAWTSLDMAQEQARINQILNVFSAIGNGPGGVGNFATDTAKLLMNKQLERDQLALAQGAESASLQQTQGNAGYIRDTNKSLQEFAARGDYENTIAGINARVQDTELTPNSVQGQLGGELMNLVNDAFGVSVRWKMIDNAHIRAIGEYWFRYGYAVQSYMKLPPRFRCMTKATYWKMSETYLSGAQIPEIYRQALRGILEKGTTFWTDPNDIGNVDFDFADNEPLTGIEY